MTSDDRKKTFLKGYEQGLRDALNEVMRLAAQGYSAVELGVLVKSKMAVLHRSVETMEGRLDSGEHKIDPAGREHAPRITQRAAYIVREAKPDEVFEILRSVEKAGSRALCVTRIHPNDLVERHKLEGAHYLWLTQSTERPKAKNVQHASPTNLVALISAVDQFLKIGGDSAVALEGLEYLVSQNGFEATMKCVQQVNEKARGHGAYLFVALDPKTLGEREYGLLAKEIGNEV